MDITSTYGLNSVVLGGGEPTADPSLTEILKLFKRLNIDIRVLTNGYRIDDYVLRELIDPTITVVVSVKNIDPLKHEEYTGLPLKPVLDNIVKMYNLGAKLIIETIFIPGFNDSYEISLLAKFIASIDSNIPLIIDPFIPVPGAPWRKPTLNELEEAERTALTYLRNVYVRGKYISPKTKGKIRLVYPKLNNEYL